METKHPLSLFFRSVTRNSPSIQPVELACITVSTESSPPHELKSPNDGLKGRAYEGTTNIFSSALAKPGKVMNEPSPNLPHTHRSPPTES